MTAGESGPGDPRPVLTGRRATLRPGRPGDAMTQRGNDGRFHDGLLMDLLRAELTVP